MSDLELEIKDVRDSLSQLQLERSELIAKVTIMKQFFLECDGVAYNYSLHTYNMLLNHKFLLNVV